MDAPVSEQPGEMAAGDSGNDEKGVQRRWAIDERDPEIAVEMSGFGDAIPGERRQVLTPTDFQNHPLYVASNQSPDSRRRRGSNSGMRDVLPDKFAGRIPWTDYRRHFDVCMRLNRWNDVEAGQFLATRLQGAALKVLNNIPIGRELTYSELASHLERRFGPGEDAENFLLELRTRRRQPKESLQELGQAIRDLTCLAYPELSRDARERLARGHFSDAIDDVEVRAGIFRAHAITLDDAIRAGLATESFGKAEKARERTRPARHVRSMESSVEPIPVDKMRKEIDGLKSSLGEMMEMMREMNMDKSKSVGIVCYNCRENGHMAKYCPKQTQGNGSRPSRWTGGRSTQQGPRM